VRSFFLMALIVLCAFPVFASTPEQDMVLIVDEGDGEFSELEQVSDEELLNIIGNIVNSGTAPDLWQEAGTQGRDEGLIFLARWRTACQSYWSPKVKKAVRIYLHIVYLSIPVICFQIFGVIPEGLIVATQAGLQSLGIGLTATQTANLLTIIITSGYTAGMDYLIDIITE